VPQLLTLRSAPIRARRFGTGDVWYGDRWLQIADPQLLRLLAMSPPLRASTPRPLSTCSGRISERRGPAARAERYKLRAGCVAWYPS